MSHATITRLCLLAATLAVFWQVRDHELVNLDDNIYMSANYHVRRGLTADSVYWALTTGQGANWMPLTRLSHMAVCHFWDIEPGPHHLVNLLLHLLAVMLLFETLYAASDDLATGAITAGLFALHPLHVESVCWVAERKGVLSTFFWTATMYAYVRYSQRPTRRRYVCVVALFVLGLMSKQMLVTLPFVLLLLDYWPLERWKAGEPRDTAGGRAGGISNSVGDQWARSIQLVREKVPLFGLTVVFCVIAYVAQHQSGAVATTAQCALRYRIGNALVVAIIYIRKALWPADLAVWYPHRGQEWTALCVIGSALALIAMSVVAIRAARRFPHVFVGWLWYLGTLMPVIGLVQIGRQGMADRYTDIPLIGLYLLVARSISLLMRRSVGWRLTSTSGAVVVLGLLALRSHRQAAYWRDDLRLFGHAIQVSENNFMAHNQLGIALAARNRPQEAIEQFRTALAIKPEFADALGNLAVVLSKLGRDREALPYFEQALRIAPLDPQIHDGLGVTLAKSSRVKEAIDHFRIALRYDPQRAGTLLNLGLALGLQGRDEDAIRSIREALRLHPTYAEAYLCLGDMLDRSGKTQEATMAYAHAVRLDPTAFSAALKLVWICSTEDVIPPEQVTHAAQLLQRAVGSGNASDPRTLSVLAAAYAARHEFSKAVELGRRAVAAAERPRDKRLLNELRRQVKAYESRQPYRRQQKQDDAQRPAVQ